MKDNTIPDMEVKDDYYMACIWPAAEISKAACAVEMLKQTGRIIYAKDVWFTYNGLKNFMIEIYGHQAWIGNIWNRFSGVLKHLNGCYCAGKPVKTYVFSAPSLDAVTAVKGEIRKMFGIGNSSIHISDNRKETSDMIQLLYNRNSVDFLNYGQPFRYKKVYLAIKKEVRLLQEENLDKARIILGPEVLMEVCGLGRALQVDGYTDYPEDVLNETENRLVIKSCTEIESGGLEVSELLYDPKNYFYHEGMKVMTPQCVLTGKLLHGKKKKERRIQKFLNRTREEQRGHDQCHSSGL